MMTAHSMVSDPTKVARDTSIWKCLLLSRSEHTRGVSVRICVSGVSRTLFHELRKYLTEAVWEFGEGFFCMSCSAYCLADAGIPIMTSGSPDLIRCWRIMCASVRRHDQILANCAACIWPLPHNCFSFLSLEDSTVCGDVLRCKVCDHVVKMPEGYGDILAGSEL